MTDKKQDKSKFGQPPGTSPGTGHAASAGASPMTCSACEAALTDALDGSLSPADQAAFDQHAGICAGCGQMVADARRGLAWLEILKETRPDPPSGIVQKILSQTSGLTADHGRAQSFALSGHATLATGGEVATHGSALSASPDLDSAPATPFSANQRTRPLSKPAWRNVNLAAIKHTLMQPRLAMTAAMAFFSISLTLNLAGVHLSDIKAADLKPSSLRRQFYEANSHVVRNIDNLRVVYEVEARVRDLRRASETDEPAASSDPVSPATNKPAVPGAKPPSGQDDPKQTAPAGKEGGKAGDGGTSRRESTDPRLGNGMHVASAPETMAPGALSPGSSASGLLGSTDVASPAGQPVRKKQPSTADHRFQPGQVVETRFGVQQHSNCPPYRRTTRWRLTCNTAAQDRPIVPQEISSKSGMPERRMA